MHNWKFFKSGRIPQVKIECGADIENLKELDRKLWTVLSCPLKGLRFDKRTLEFLDSDHDGHIRAPEVVAAVEWLKGKGVNLESLFKKDEADVKALEDVTAQQAALDKAPPSKEDVAAMKAWEEAPSKDAAILPYGDKTAAANDALAAVEPVIDEFFAVPADMPLVTEEADKVLPLKKNLNPKWSAAVGTFASTALETEAESLSRSDWAAAKAKLAPYRAWLASKPVMAADAKAKLEDQEKLLRLKLNFVEFLRNFVNQGGLYDYGSLAIYQTGTLYIDAREMPLTFHVDDAGAHAALAGRSECYLLYVKLTRDGGAAARTVCAAVTAGFAGSLWPGKNGVFIDRDGLDWDATVTSVVEKQISLREAFWAPWKKIFTTVAEQAKKFLGAKQDAAVANVTTKATAAPAAAPADKGSNGAAIASSIAAIGIGVGMLGTACAALIGLVAGLPLWKVALGLLCVVLIVSMPSVILTYFKLRKRDIGAILNACGWAVNRPLYFSMKRANLFTHEAKIPASASLARDPYADGHPVRNFFIIVLLLLAVAAGALWYFCPCRRSRCKAEAAPSAETAPAAPAEAPAAPAEAAPQA